MQWQDIEMQWEVYQEKAKRHWRRLSDEQLQSMDGKLDRLTDHIQALYRLPRVVAEDEVYEWLDTFEQDYSTTARANIPRVKKVPSAALSNLAVNLWGSNS